MKTRRGKKINIGFVNQYSLHDQIPNRWFEWEKSVNSQFMLIGKYWGPYKALLKLNKEI